MIVDKIKKEFNNSSDLIIKKIKSVDVVFLESANSGDKVNDYVLKVLMLKDFKRNLNDLIAGPNTKVVDSYDKCEFFLVNGFTLIIHKESIYAVETRAVLFRAVSTPQTQQSILGPKDAFTENIQMNVGLVKRRVKSSKLCNDDFFIGRKTLTKVSVLYLNDICDLKLVESVKKKLKSIDLDGILDSGNIAQVIAFENKTPLPTVMEVERPDRVANDLLDGKIAIAVDNSPFMIVLPTFFFDFINPQVDDYNKNLNVNVIKIIRFFCLLITIMAPAIYIALINYNQETIPFSLLVSFSQQRSIVPFPAAIECFLMLFLSEILRESDIRFPSTFGSSVSILGALILGNASVSAGIVSPIMIIVVAVSFISSLIFTDMELINSLRLFRFLFLFVAAISGLFGVIVIGFMFLIHLSSIESFGRPYTYPLAPFDKVYAGKILFKNTFVKDKYRSKFLSNNKTKKRDI